MELTLINRLRVEVGLSEKDNDEGVAGSVALNKCLCIGGHVRGGKVLL